MHRDYYNQKETKCDEVHTSLSHEVSESFILLSMYNVKYRLQGCGNIVKFSKNNKTSPSLYTFSRTEATKTGKCENMSHYRVSRRLHDLSFTLNLKRIQM